MLVPSILFCFVLTAATTGLPSGYSFHDGNIIRNHGNVIRNIKVESQSGTPTDVHHDYPQVFTHKTSLLLAEALDMLHRAKDIKEKQWLEAFVNRLGRLAAEMERPSLTRIKPNSLAHKSVAVQPSHNSAIWTRHGSHSESNNAEMSLKSLKLTNKTSTFLKPEEDELVQQLHSQPVNPSINSTNIRMPPRNHLLATSVTTAATPTSTVLKLPKMVNQNSVSKSILRKKILKQILKKIHLLEKVGGIKDVLTILKREEESLDDPKESSDMNIEEGAAEGEISAINNVENLRTVAPSANDLPDIYSNGPGKIATDSKKEPVPDLPAEVLGSMDEEVSYRTTEETVPASQNTGFQNEQDDGRYEANVKIIPVAQRDDDHHTLDDELVRQLEEEKYITVATKTSIVHNQNERANTGQETIGESSKPSSHHYMGDRGENTLDQLVKSLSRNITRHVMK